VAIQPGQRVGGGVSDDRIGEGVADALQGSAGQEEVLDREAPRHIEAGVDGADDPVRAGPGAFDDNVAGVVDDVGVVTRSAAHGAGADPAIEPVVAASAEQEVVAVAAEEPVVSGQTVQRVGNGVAYDHVVQGVADPRDCRSGQDQVLDVDSVE